MESRCARNTECTVVDPAVRRALHAGWPESQPLAGMDPLNTNALCMLAGWRVATNERLIREAWGM